MGDMLSQAEIDALLGGPANSEPTDTAAPASSLDDLLSSEQKDILGEIGNISMGTSATTLFALLNQKVWITTPKVKIITWGELSKGYDRPCVGVRVDYKEGLRGSNVLVLKQKDVKIIGNLMMGGDGIVGDDIELTDIDLSAIGEAMNQMVGSSSTSISSMLHTKIDIDTPHAFILDFNADNVLDTIGFDPNEAITCISFKMEIGSLIDSEIMQLLPTDFAVEMVEKLKYEMMGGVETQAAPVQQAAAPQPTPAPVEQYPQYREQAPPVANPYPQPVPEQYAYPPQPSPEQYAYPPYPPQPSPEQYAYPPQSAPYPYPPQQAYYAPPPQQAYYAPPTPQPVQQNINAQPAQFQSFDMGDPLQQKENIDIIMDVPLEVTVELGRTRKKIKEILEFSPGTIVELDKLAGEPIDILVNGKFVARGEVVVIDENFGIRITDIISVEKRI